MFLSSVTICPAILAGYNATVIETIQNTIATKSKQERVGEESRREVIQTIARKMLSKQRTIEEIAELTQEQIEQLKLSL